MSPESIVLVLATDRPPPLEPLQWATRLSEMIPAELLAGESARFLKLHTTVAASLEAGLGIQGIAFFGHGERDRLCEQGTDDRCGEPWLAAATCNADANLVSARWIFAFACRAAAELGLAACRHGCTLFAGWTVDLRIGQLSQADLEVLAAAVLSVPLGLARGERSADALRVSLQAACAKAEDELDRADTLSLSTASLLEQLLQITFHEAMTGVDRRAPAR